jgi:hypothetical protein
MSQTVPEPNDPQVQSSPPDMIPPTVPGPVNPLPQNRAPVQRQALMEWVARNQQVTASWLYELGGWVFGALILAALVLLQDLIGIGSAEHAALIAGLALAVALPFDLVGLGVMRYFRDLNQASEQAKHPPMQSADSGDETLYTLASGSGSPTQARRKVMDFTIALSFAVSLLFTLIGIGSALWRISWAVTILFFLVCILGGLLLLRVIRYSA